MKPIVDRSGNIFAPEGDIVLTTGKLIGLGDHMIYSTLPKRFKELGYKVYVDKDNCARNDDIMDMVWQRNPYIDGASDKKPNAGYVRQGLFYEIANRYPIGSIEAMERAHGLPPPYSIAPYINYQPKAFHHDVSRTVLVDFSAVSSRIEPQGIQEFIRAMRGRFRNPQMIQIMPPKFASLHPPQLAMDTVQIDGIEQYLDALHSCHAWVGSEAGGQALAAAARGEHDVYDLTATPQIVVLSTPKTYNSKGYTFRGSNYHVTIFGQDKHGDFFFPHELETHVYDIRCAWSYEQMRSENPDAWKPVIHR